MSVKPDWEDRLCPGGCGEVHRPCCDSVVGSDHQSCCQDVAQRMTQILLRAGESPEPPVGITKRSRARDAARTHRAPKSRLEPLTSRWSDNPRRAWASRQQARLRRAATRVRL